MNLEKDAVIVDGRIQSAFGIELSIDERDFWSDNLAELTARDQILSYRLNLITDKINTIQSKMSCVIDMTNTTSPVDILDPVIADFSDMIKSCKNEFVDTYNMLENKLARHNKGIKYHLPVQLPEQQKDPSLEAIMSVKISALAKGIRALDRADGDLNAGDREAIRNMKQHIITISKSIIQDDSEAV